MAEGRSPLYLARASYRRRRLIDALRLTPIALFLLWLLPLLWGGDPLRASETGVRALIHIFVIWFFGILITAALARRLLRSEEEHGQAPEDGFAPTRGGTDA